jgi:hypothetical protein
MTGFPNGALSLASRAADLTPPDARSADKSVAVATAPAGWALNLPRALALGACHFLHRNFRADDSRTG